MVVGWVVHEWKDDIYCEHILCHNFYIFLILSSFHISDPKPPSNYIQHVKIKQETKTRSTNLDSRGETCGNDPVRKRERFRGGTEIVRRVSKVHDDQNRREGYE